MQSLDNLSFNCLKHPQQKVMFVCAVNDWHFQLLCQLCTPQHTQNHSKRLKINLQSIEEINKKVINRKTEVITKYTQQLTKVKSALDQKVNTKQQKQTSPIYYKDLQMIENNLIHHIKSYFTTLKVSFQKFKQSYLIQNVQKLYQLDKNIIQQIKFISGQNSKQFQQKDINQLQLNQQNMQKWKQSAKKTYFVEKQQAYIQQSTQIIDQFIQKQKQVKLIMQKTIKQCFKNQQKLFKQLQKLLNVNGVKFDCQVEKKLLSSTKDIKEENNKMLKKVIAKPKKKVCKNCNQQMQYLTQNKKHLICKFCNFKQRNYIKKPL